MCMHVRVCTCFSTTLPPCQDPDVLTFTPLCYWFCIKDCQDTATTGRNDTACNAGANNIWAHKVPTKKDTDTERETEGKTEIDSGTHTFMHG